MQESFRIGLVQTSCSLDPNENLAKDGMESPRSRRPRSAGHLPAGAVPVPVFLPRGERRAVRAGRIHSRTFDGNLGQTRARAEGGHRGVVVRAPARRGPVSQHCCRTRSRWGNHRTVPENAHSGRSAVFREILFHAGRSGLQQHRHALRPPGRVGLLGSVVSGRRAHRGAFGRRLVGLPHCDRMAPFGEKPSTEPPSWMPGAPSSARTPSPTASTSPP